jgi:hypothetical protein
MGTPNAFLVDNLAKEGCGEELEKGRGPVKDQGARKTVGILPKKGINPGALAKPTDGYPWA